MGRPTLDKKDTLFRMRVSESEKNMLKELANLHNMKMSEYIIMLIKQEYNKIREE